MGGSTKSSTEALARLLYATFCVWDYERNGRVKPRWESLRSDFREDFLTLAERLTLEDR